MRLKLRVMLLLAMLLALIALPGVGAAQDGGELPPPAEIVNDEGGPVAITGTMRISNPNIISASFELIVILEDQTGFVERDFDYVFPPESQVIGAWTAPIAVGDTPYSLSLPAAPQGTFNDVDNDGVEEQGVQIFQVAAWDDEWGGPFIDERDGTGWSSANSTVLGSSNPATLGEYQRGTLIVWAPDDQQSFPAGFGEDGLLFTEDDTPMVTLPQGYTLVSFDVDNVEAPFVFDRSREPELELIEPDSFVPDDFSDLSYTEAFNALVDKAIREYPGTEFKGIDWEALREEFLPRFEEAEANNDTAAYVLAIRDFAWRIPDGHIQFSDPIGVTTEEFVEDTDGGLGMAAIETDDGRFLVHFVLEGGPAEEAGIELLAELIEVNGMPVEEAMAMEVVHSAPWSTEEWGRVQQLRYLLSAPVDTDFEITYQNPDADAPETVTLTTIPERESFAYTSIARDAPVNPPQISFEFLENNVGYVQVSSFGSNGPFLIATWEEFIGQAISLNSPGIVVDLRFNGGGFSSFGNRMASYFFTEETPMYYAYGYNDELEDFWTWEEFPVELLPPLDESLIYNGPVAVLTGPSCASACEFFAYALGFDDRAAIVAQNSTYGIAFGWIGTDMPDGVTFALPTSGDINFDGEFIIEGEGVEIDIKVPINEETILDTETDFVLEAGLEYIEAESEVELVDAGDMTLGEPATGTLERGQAARYTLQIPDETSAIDIIVSESSPGTQVVVYIAGNETQPALPTVTEDAIGIGGAAGLTLTIDVIATGDYNVTIRDTDDAPPPEFTVIEGAEITPGETVTGELLPNVRIQYELEIERDMTLDFILGDETQELDTYIRLYVDGDEEPTYENDDIDPGVLRNSELLGIEFEAGQTVIVEVAGWNEASEGEYTLFIKEVFGE